MGQYHRIITIVPALLISAGFVGAAINYSYLESRTDFFSRAGGIQRRLEAKIVAFADPAEQCSAFYQATSRINADDFRLFSEWIMNRFPYVSGMIFAPLVPAAERPGFEETVRKEGLVTFRIHASAKKSAPQGEGNALPILHLEPLRPESAFLLGLDLESRQEFSGILARVIAEDTTLLVESPGLLGQTKEFWLVRAAFRGRSRHITLDNAAGLILLRIDLIKVIESLLKGKEHSDLTFVLTSDGKGPDQSIYTSRHRSSDKLGQGHRRFSYQERFPALGHTFLTRYREKLPHAAIFFNRVVAMAFVGGILIFMALMSLSRQYHRRRRANVALARINKELQQREEQLRQLNEQLEERVRTRTLQLTESNNELRQANDDLKIAQSRALQQEELLRATIEAAPTAIIGLDLDGNVHSIWNRAAERMLEWSAREVMGRPLPIMTEENKEEVKRFYKQIRSGKTLNGVEVRRKKRDGSPIDYSVYASSLHDTEGNIIGNIAVLVDITERKLLEDQLQRKNEDLERSNAELEQFAYLASHDLQEPLRKVSSYMALVAERYRDELDQDARVFIDYSVDGARRMKIMIDDLLDYSRVGTRGKTFAPVDMMNVMHEVLDDLELAIRENEAVVAYDALPVVQADDSQLQQLFRNLVGNAIKYRGPDPPQIRVSAERQEQAWQICVKDNGIGIEPRFFERIFQIFQRLHPRGRFDGTGIGLAVCKKIVERHGGTIGVESAPGRGSMFHFTIADRKEGI